MPAEVAAASGKNRSVPAPQALAAKEKRRLELQAKYGGGKLPRLIIRNLPWTIKTEADLEKLFRSFGKVNQVNLPKKGPGLLRGFGFVLLRGRKNAEKAVAALNGKEIDGRPIAVDWAVDKTTWENQTRDKESVRDDSINATVDIDSKNGEESARSSTNDESAASGKEGSDMSAGDGELSDSDREIELPKKNTSEHEVLEQSDTGVSPNTLFVRNLPFSTTDEDLATHFASFGPLRYARVVLDHETGRPRGTAFVCFRGAEDAKECLRNAPRNTSGEGSQVNGNTLPTGQSVLQDSEADPLGKYTLEGRVLQLARAVDKTQAAQLANAGAAAHEQKSKDKRRLYLLNEGSIPIQSSMWESLSSAEKAIREASLKQRKALVQSNPSLNLSLTRLSVRNIPRTVTSKMLKELAVQAVVGFAQDVKAGKREKLSKEELSRAGDSMQQAEKHRKLKRKGIVKQAKIVFETTQGSKTDEKEGGGRSRGYGFIEYYTHRTALMGLRWLNGHGIDYKTKEPTKRNPARDDLQDRKRRLIVEFAIENAQVTHRRTDRENKAREQAEEEANTEKRAPANQTKPNQAQSKQMNEGAAASVEPNKGLEKLKRRQQIIARKRAKRRDRGGLR